MDNNKLLEIKKLWFVAEKYYDLAMVEKKSVPNEELELTVEELKKKCPDLSDLQSNQHLIYFSAHIASCAVRLCSIDTDFRASFNRHINIKLLV